MDKLKRILSSVPEDAIVVDVGTGVGSFIEILDESLMGCRSIIGIDSKEVAIDRAREYFKNNTKVEFKIMDAEKMDFKDESIDIVSISNTIHHLPHKEKVLSEMKRVLKPGGLMIVNEMISDGLTPKQRSHMLLHHLSAEINTLCGVYHERTMTRKEYIDVLNSLGMDQVGTFDYCTEEEQLKDTKPKEEKEALDEWFGAIDKGLERIKDLPEYKGYVVKLNNLKQELYKIGYLNATEVVAVYRK